MGFQNTKISLLLLLGPVISVTSHAEVYLNAEQAARIFFPDQTFKRIAVVLKDDEKSRIEKLSKNSLKSKNLNVLISKEASFVFMDQVIGKHELITYAVGIGQDGKIRGVEVLEYRESYGHQIRREVWRKQFVGKDKKAELQVGRDIKNLSGATLSSTHVTDGVRRILHTYEQIKSRL